MRLDNGLVLICVVVAAVGLSVTAVIIHEEANPKVNKAQVSVEKVGEYKKCDIIKVKVSDKWAINTLETLEVACWR